MRANSRRPAKRLLFLGISLVYWGLGAAKRAIGLFFGAKCRTFHVVLTYHAVLADEVGDFARQMQHLKHRATPVFAGDSGTANGRRSVAVTFDDGFQNVFDGALPVLARQDIPATVFVPTGYLGLEPGWIEAGDVHPPRSTVVSADALRKVDYRRVRIGSHSVTHPRLARVDEDQLEAELTVSRATLEAITGDQVSLLALPYGSCAPHVVAAARRAGYQRVFANVPLPPDPVVSSMLVGRTDVSPSDWPLEFYLKLVGAYQWRAFAIPAKRAVLRFLGRPA